METKEIIKSQYYASFEMLKQAIEKCPNDLWDHPNYKSKFWHVAYHAIFFTHLYLHPSEEEFKPWEKHRKEYQFLGPLPWPPHKEPEIGEQYSKEEVLAYLSLCREQADKKIDSLDLEAESGFSWLPFNKLELQFYNIRHLHQHIGELCDRLGTMADIEVDWVAMRDGGNGK